MFTSDMGWESNWCALAPAPLAGCQPLVSRAAASTSKQAEPWEKLRPLPQRTSIPSEGLSSSPGEWLSHLPISMCGFSLQTTSKENDLLRGWSSNSTHLMLFKSFSSLSPWRHQVSMMGQRLSFYRELIESNVEQRCSVLFCSLPWRNGLSLLDIRGWTAFA